MKTKVKENQEVTKDEFQDTTVSLRFDIQKSLHGRIMKHRGAMINKCGREVPFYEACIDLFESGLACYSIN